MKKALNFFQCRSRPAGNQHWFGYMTVYDCRTFFEGGCPVEDVPKSPESDRKPVCGPFAFTFLNQAFP